MPKFSDILLSCGRPELSFRKLIIGVVAPPEEPQTLWLEQITDAFPVRFERRKPGQYEGIDALIVFGDIGLARLAFQLGLFSVLALPKTEGGSSVVSQIEFGSHSLVPKVFWGQTVSQDQAGALAPLTGETDELPVTKCDGRAAWVAKREKQRRFDASAMTLPSKEGPGSEPDWVRPGNFTRILPVLDFIRQLTGQDGWSAPFHRACFMFDDPNLHGTRYGWLDYRELADQGDRHEYHSAFATVPLDTWWTNSSASRLFVERRRRLSLLIHGNNHCSYELIRFGSETASFRMLAQALRRAEKLERTTSVPVSRVMAPPHSACTDEGFDVMRRLGYEGVCVAGGSLRSFNSDKPWIRGVGFRVSEMVGGFPVIPRIPFARCTSNAVLLAAYLNQPIIPYGHHQDVAGGLGLLEDLANRINSLGNVHWTNMAELARSNYQTRQEAGVCRVQPFANLFTVTPSPDLRELVVEKPWQPMVTAEAISVRVPNQAPIIIAPGASGSLSIPQGSQVEINFIRADAEDAHSLPAPGAQPVAFVRRQLCEARDRLRPAMASLTRGIRNPRRV